MGWRGRMGHWHRFHWPVMYYRQVLITSTCPSSQQHRAWEMVFVCASYYRETGCFQVWTCEGLELRFQNPGLLKEAKFYFLSDIGCFLIKWCATCAKMNTSHPCSMHSKQTYHHLLEPVNSRVFAKYDSQRQLFDPGRVLWDCHLSACVIWAAEDSLLGLSLNYYTKTWWSSKFHMSFRGTEDTEYLKAPSAFCYNNRVLKTQFVLAPPYLYIENNCLLLY